MPCVPAFSLPLSAVGGLLRQSRVKATAHSFTFVVGVTLLVLIVSHPHETDSESDCDQSLSG